MTKKRSVKSEVLEVLSQYPRARDNDNVLMAHVWQLEDGSLPVDLAERLERLSRAETIRRECKTIQHVEQRFRPSPSVLEARRPRIGPRRRRDE